MEADVLNALSSQSAYLPGGRDSDGNLIVVVNVPYDVQPWSKQHLELTINYLIGALSAETLAVGISAIVDAQKCNWRVARLQIRHVSALLGVHLKSTYVIRPEAFWEKQRVETCAKTHKKGEPFILSKTRLLKHFDAAELPLDLGGTFAYNHELWIHNRIRYEEFKKSYEKAINDLENLHIILLDNKSIRASEIESTIKSCSIINLDVQIFIQSVLDNGNKFINQLTELKSSPSFIAQDLIDAAEAIKSMLNDIDRKQSQITIAWTDLEKSIEDVRELANLEDGVSYVTNWILATAESLLNAQLRVGYDVQTSEKLRLDHELLEMQCWKTYGFYAELLYKIDNIPALKSSFAHIDLLSQRDFMDFVCRSFATRLERRRNILISSVRFYRLVSEYFERTSAVFESLIMGDKVDDYDMAKMKLQKLKDSQNTLEHIEKELNREGEKLSDVLAMPIKDALGREINVDYTDDIANIRDILDATIARRNIFIDSVELQKLTLEQITFIHTYESEALMASTWMDDLYKVMIKSHTHVGCNIREIQLQKDEHQAFQETAKGTYNYGCQLLSAALSLRQACKLAAERNANMMDGLQRSWKHFQIVSQEQMTRLRVSAVFHRSVAEHCSKLYDLQNIVLTLNEIECQEKRKTKLRKYLTSREKLLLEVGRMVRLGRLLKSRLREPFRLSDRIEDMSNQDNILSTSDNTVACEAIMEKLTEVSRIAESLDHVLKNTKANIESVDSDETTSTLLEKKQRSNNNSDDWGSSVKSSTEDESFVTASDCAGTPQSRSSSYHTASECRGSPWWESTERSSVETETSDIDVEGPSLRLLSGVISSANISFDESETSYRTAAYTTASDHTDSDDARKRGVGDLASVPDDSDKQTISSAGDNNSDTASTDNLLSPTTSSNETLDRVSVEDDVGGDDANSKLPIGEMSGLSFYYQNIITNQAVKTCL